MNNIKIKIKMSGWLETYKKTKKNSNKIIQNKRILMEPKSEFEEINDLPQPFRKASSPTRDPTQKHIPTRN
jgi:hypothetical protein